MLNLFVLWMAIELVQRSCFYMANSSFGKLHRMGIWIDPGAAGNDCPPALFRSPVEVSGKLK